MTSIFLSYARGDDAEPFESATSFVARLHCDLTAAGFDIWFDRVSMPSRTLTFHQEIRDAVAACDRLVLVVGPKAAESLYVRQEWQFAYFEAEKIVTPILRCGDYPNVPDELKLLHCEDFRDDGQYDFHLKNIIRQLAEPTPALGKLIGVPSLPPHFLSRTDRLTALRDALRADLDRPVVITGAAARVGMHGMGGIGKSVLAATLSRDRKVREAFPDGIVWVGLGPLPTVADLQRRVHKDLGGDGAFQTEHEGRVKLRDILKDKGVLLILDDVWRRDDVDWFDVLGPRCRAMITTRDAGLLTSLGGVHHQVELLTDAEALNLLAQAAGVERDKLPGEAADLIAECGRLPLAVALCGGMVRSGMPWHDVLAALREHELEFISNEHRSESHHTNLWRAMEVSVRMLNERAGDEPLLKDAAHRFAELAVFSTDEPIPEAAILTLWSHTGGLNERNSRKLLILLQQRSLVEITRTDKERGPTVSLHDLLFDLAIRLSQCHIGETKALHNLVVEAYTKQCRAGWPSGPNDGYFFTHLRQHLIAAGRARELAELLHELPWLEAKNEAGLTFDLPRDFGDAMNALPLDDVHQQTLRLLHEALLCDIHFIARHGAIIHRRSFSACGTVAGGTTVPKPPNTTKRGQKPEATSSRRGSPPALVCARFWRVGERVKRSHNRAACGCGACGPRAAISARPWSESIRDTVDLLKVWHFRPTDASSPLRRRTGQRGCGTSRRATNCAVCMRIRPMHSVCPSLLIALRKSTSGSTPTAGFSPQRRPEPLISLTVAWRGWKRVGSLRRVAPAAPAREYLAPMAPALPPGLYRIPAPKRR